MRPVDTSLYSNKKPKRIQPDAIDLSDLPRIEKPRLDQPTVGPTDQPTKRPTFAATNRPTDQPPVDRFEASRKRRSLVRKAFDLYEYQWQAIRKFRAQRSISEGEDVSYSDIARAAFDLYLKA